MYATYDIAVIMQKVAQNPAVLASYVAEIVKNTSYCKTLFQFYSISDVAII